MGKKYKLTKKQRERRRNLLLGALFVLLVFLGGYWVGRNGFNEEKWADSIARFEQRVNDFFEDKTPRSTETTATAEIKVLDVGQGSATLLQSEDGTNILIDSGRYNDGEKRILQYLDRYVGTGGTLDLLIFTHNDADHIGFGDRIISYYSVEEVWMNGVDATTKVYEEVLDAIASSNATYVEPKAGDKKQVGPFHFTVLNPATPSSNNQNNQSIAAKIDVNDFSLLVTGDADASVEQRIIENTFSLQSNALILGHHGANDSTSDAWLQATQPEVAIYSAGEDNIYGHPHTEVLERVKNHQIPVYGTDKHGTISITIDQTGTYTVETEKGEEDHEDGA